MAAILPVVRVDLNSPHAALAEKRINEAFPGKVQIVKSPTPAQVRLVPLGELPATPGQEVVIAVGDADLPTTILEMRRLPWLDHVVSPALLERDLASSPSGGALWRVIAERRRMVRRSVFFGKGFHGRQAKLRDSSRREKRIDQIAELARRAGGSSRLADRVRDVAEEMLTNALYDAPAEKRGQTYDRGRRVVLSKDCACSITYGATHQTFFLRVRDHYGSLVRHRLFEVLGRCAEAGGNLDFDTSRGGAGLGLWRIFSTASLVVVQVVPGVSTEFLVGIDLHTRRGARSDRSIHLFFDKAPVEHARVIS